MNGWRGCSQGRGRCMHDQARPHVAAVRAAVCQTETDAASRGEWVGISSRSRTGCWKTSNKANKTWDLCIKFHAKTVWIYMLFILYFSVYNSKKTIWPTCNSLSPKRSQEKKKRLLNCCSPDFRQMLIQKDADEKAEKLRKEQRN